IGACLGGYGIAQPMELSIGELLRDGALVELFPRWQDERFPLYLYHPSRHLPPAKLRAFIDFVVASSRESRRAADRRTTRDAVARVRNFPWLPRRPSVTMPS